ncbi:OLC1v1030188C1 [Oldenlandia corymbosa var. corymbosa]|uniref:OLC1v1030188C1 n=1 Tax=Oldenlandia corymbosa var. corymbosa TaxID=529605 RepID=A0AAV1CFF5_OLDCO|nr:OLC1v1030188C1 [Oldenlandia corymbosa var. corymbosa]
MALIHISFSRLFLPIIVLVLAINGKAAHAAVESHFCAQAAPGEEKILCNTLVNGAPTWEAAFTNVVQEYNKQVAPIKPLITNLAKTLPASLQSESKDSIAQSCNESLGLFNDSIANILKSLKTGNKLLSLDSEIAASFSGLSDCTDGLQEFNINSAQIQNIVDLARKYADISAVVAHTKPN